MEFNKKDVKILILSGKAGSGKSTVADMIKEILDKKVVILSYASYLKMYAKEILGYDEQKDVKPREFLQHLGVELIKNNIDDKMLIRRIIEDIKVYSYFYDVIVISDARFISEIEDIKTNFDNVTVIHIDGFENNLTADEKKHSTEVALDGYNNYDYVIDNKVSKEELKNKIESILKVCYENRD